MKIEFEDCEARRLYGPLDSDALNAVESLLKGWDRATRYQVVVPVDGGDRKFRAEFIYDDSKWILREVTL